ncbi:hypothetical protein [Streptomyces chiangmaiensis]|uniref:Uncharacterized protein n=1 Tax=Streptomyces chiangmaiensis TaxID=766497 RepID=A0ABU7FSJ7_9ACTN|nr:hypothetical protein [Streptomyces chiangmaiensis]MED7827067.1 hypothetical protein [Streptomyces chiangmaiensis]
MRGSAGDTEQAAEAAEKQANRLVSWERAANEHGVADPKNWRVLTKLRLNAKHATTLPRALPFLTNAEMSH